MDNISTVVIAFLFQKDKLSNIKALKKYRKLINGIQILQLFAIPRK